MIILKLKDMDKLKAKIGENNLLIVCGLCPCWNFSKEDIETTGGELKARIVKVPTICNRPSIMVDREYDSIMVLACGAGTQVVSEVLDKDVTPVADTMGIGVKSDGKIEEYCSACGDCVLGETAAVCPIARCAKSLLNGPCGGVHDRQCELEDRDCVWIQIYEKMKGHGKAGEFSRTITR